MPLGLSVHLRADPGSSRQHSGPRALPPEAQVSDPGESRPLLLVGPASGGSVASSPAGLGGALPGRACLLPQPACCLLPPRPRGQRASVESRARSPWAGEPVGLTASVFSAQASRASRRAASPTTARPGRTTTKNRVSASASSRGSLSRGPHACGLQSPLLAVTFAARPACVRLGVCLVSSPATCPSPVSETRGCPLPPSPPRSSLPGSAGASASLGRPREDPWLGTRPAGGCWPSRRPVLPGHRGAGETGR